MLLGRNIIFGARKKAGKHGGQCVHVSVHIGYANDFTVHRTYIGNTSSGTCIHFEDNVIINMPDECGSVNIKLNVDGVAIVSMHSAIPIDIQIWIWFEYEYDNSPDEC